MAFSPSSLYPFPGFGGAGQWISLTAALLKKNKKQCYKNLWCAFLCLIWYYCSIHSATVTGQLGAHKCKSIVQIKSYSSRELSHLLLNWVQVLWIFLLLLFCLNLKMIGWIVSIFCWYHFCAYSSCGSPWDLAVRFSRRLLFFIEFLCTRHILRVFPLSVGGECPTASQIAICHQFLDVFQYLLLIWIELSYALDPKPEVLR